MQCGHCGEDFATNRVQESDSHLPWYYRSYSIVAAVCCFGPLALPLIWKRPHLSRTWKTALTVLILALTLGLCWVLYFMIVLLIGIIRDFVQLNQSL